MRYNGIQYLRGIAALLIMWAHLRFAGDFIGAKIILNGAGAIGVDIFFVISGFVISISAQQLEFQSLKFLLYRLARIIPFYWLMSLPLALYNIYLGLWNWDSFISTLLFLPFFDHLTYTNPIHWLGWSLSYEFWFYCLFAILMRLFKNKALIILPIFLITMCIITTFLYHADYYLPKFLFHPFTLEFVGGVLLYQIAHKLGYKALFISAIIMSITAFFILTKIDHLGSHMLVLHNIEKGFIRVFIWGLFAISIVSFFIAIDNLKLYSWGTYSALLGNSSFALYLIQPYAILIAIEAKSYGLSDYYSGTIYIALVLILGILISKTIELPLMRLTKKQLKNKIFPKLFKE